MELMSYAVYKDGNGDIIKTAEIADAEARRSIAVLEANGGCAPIIVDNGDGTFDLHYKYGMKEDVGSLKTDAWEFEMPDGSVIRKDVVVKL